MSKSANGDLNDNSDGSPTSSRKEKSRYVTRHNKYYMVGGDLYVLIEHVLFKIHSYFFKREARNFFDDGPADDTNSRPHSGEIDHGTSEDKAIRILDVTVEEFEQFLWVFYNPYYNIYNAPIASWFTILKLAHRWDFPGVKAFALRELKRRELEVPLVTRIRLYQDYEAPPEYLVPLYGELCARDLTPTEDEAMELGFERMYRVFKARELLRSPVEASDSGPLCPLPEGLTEEATYPTIEEVFGLPPYSPVDGEDGLYGGGESHRQGEAVGSRNGEQVPTIKTPNPEKKKDRTKKKSKN
ncbi:hypothetical protein EST38_g9202 [Candolleomyces aberdarensis]|uniref:BTB domain-containing protein n=1 Tax=Candolleomyces aberdarensis TaxID=2316362 RepID=A0A4Q2DCA3_9AGAR|nr:hypothetical protein EST38_g9202 [Candolleomyces aberdarensis]